ncbi:peptide chain release factor aRF-1 [Candidatus Woesearchaeota archaeon]|nr:peptide chain release factor aRF-1 [Candidatus Woesearchaeota archaeon]
MPNLTSQQEFKLKKFVKKMAQYRGSHTELVTVYVPEGYDMNKIIQHLAQEQGTATNIKSKQTKDNVLAALERMIQHLKLYKKTPEYGLAAFAGNVSDRPGQQNYEVWSIEPPLPLKLRLYRCDKEFVLQPLEEMLESTDVFGLVVMDRREANIAVLRGKTIVPLLRSTSNVPGKQRAGGQSAQRFERLREGAAKEFYNRIAEHMKEQFLNMKELKGIIVGGPGPTKQEFVEGNYITNEVKKKILTLKDITYTDAFGLQELVDKSQDILAEAEVGKEKKLMNEFLEKLSKSPEIVEYGEKQVMHALKMGAVDKVLVSETVPDEVVEHIEEEAKKVGTTVEIISTETREGAQLVDLGKVGALLRFQIS